MSDEGKEEGKEDRHAEIRIVQVKDTTIHRIDIKFLGHITTAVRWDDAAPDARSEVMALLRDFPGMAKGAFIEIDVANAHDALDTELADMFGLFGHQDPEKEDGE